MGVEEMFEFLLMILLMVAAARISGELMEKAGQASVLGELVAGVGLGGLAAAFAGPFSFLVEMRDTEVFRALVDVGIFFLMLMTGMEMELEELARASRKGFVIALGGMAFPFALGYGLGMIFLPESDYKFAQAFFLGVALSITAIAVSARVLVDLKQIHTRLGHTIISAAVIDDVLGLGMLAVLTSFLELGSIPSGGEVGILAGKMGGFFLAAFFAAKILMPHLGRAAKRVKERARELDFTIVLGIALGLAAIAEILGMHFIIGAFLAGLLVRERDFGAEVLRDVHDRISGITLGFLAPIFFASIGLQLKLSALGAAFPFVLALIGAAMAGKIAGCGLSARLLKFSPQESIAIGIGMNGRGAVELVVAAIALDAGLFEFPDPSHPIIAAVFPGIVLMAIITTIMTPLGLRRILRRNGIR